MKRRIENNINIIIVWSMLILMISLSSCKMYHNTFIDSCNDEVLYKNETDCSLFKYGFTKEHYKYYKPKKCFKIKYNFTEVEFDELKILYKKVSQLSKNGLKKNSFYFVSETENSNKELLVNNKYGLYKVVGNRFAPFFYFLHTESGFYFYDCKQKSLLFEELNKSNSIDNTLKKNIIKFIENRCKTKNGLKWYAGARFY